MLNKLEATWNVRYIGSAENVDWEEWDGKSKKNNKPPLFVRENGNVYGFVTWHRDHEIQRYNFKIQFHETTWVLKKEGGGFDGHYNVKAAQIKPEPFGVLKVDRDKNGSCDILVWSDGACDGNRCYLINVPYGKFKQVKEKPEKLGVPSFAIQGQLPICPRCNDTSFVSATGGSTGMMRRTALICDKCNVQWDMITYD